VGNSVDKNIEKDIYYNKIIAGLTKLGLILSPFVFVTLLFLSVLGGGLGGSDYNPLLGALEIFAALGGVYFLNIVFLRLIYKRRLKAFTK